MEKDTCLKLEKEFEKRLTDANIKRVLVGLSGGADSTALLRLLIGSQKFRSGNLDLKCIHCNFHLRGEESERDQRFCENLCQNLGIPLTIADFDAQKTAAVQKISIEVACRQLRYDFFEEVIRSEGWDMIAVAHHLEDNAETLLLNLMRGSGINGLKGMRRINGHIFRPLLEFSRKELLGYLQSIGQDYIVDSTNLQTDYRRNFLRLEVIPLLEQRWPEASRLIARSATILAGEADILNKHLQSTHQGNRLSLNRIRASEDPVTEIYYFIKDAEGTPDIAREIWLSITSPNLKSASGKWWRLGSSHRVSLEREYIELLPAESLPLKPIKIEIVDLTPKLFQEIRRNKDQRRAWIPYIYKEALIIRPYKEGDRILKSRGESALVSKLMKDAKYTRAQKESTPVVTDREGNILWVAGLRRSCLALVPEDAGPILQLTLEEQDT